MAFMVDHQRSSLKHFCKICKKGFTCGRALGGHMRAHGVGDESIHMDDDDPMSTLEDNKNGEHNPSGSSRRMYALRANPNRLKTCRICQNCGKEFLSWKLFLEHAKKCGSEESEDEDEDGIVGGGRGWCKRKRSLRVDTVTAATCLSNEEEDLANCLVMLSNARSAEPEESCTSANIVTINNTNMEKAKGVARGLFQCKACKKVFNSHQALGGHRASHKRVKGCFAAKLDQVDDYVPEDEIITHEELFPTMQKLVQKSKVHECSICHRVFSSGQALGGHKRCHWITSNSPDTASLVKLQQFHDHLEKLQQSQTPNTKFHSSDPIDLKLHLNIPETIVNPIPLQTGFELSTKIYLQSWLGIHAKEREVHNLQQVDHHHQQLQIDREESSKKNGVNSKKNYEQNVQETDNVEDEGNSKVKFVKLSELKDITLKGEGSSSWLQVGIVPTSTDHHR